MNSLIKIFLIPLGCILFTAASGLSTDFTFVQVIDGDTFEVMSESGKRIEIDLAGIDAPEMPLTKSKKGQPFCQKAKQMLSEMIRNKPFSYKSFGKSDENRVIAVIHSEGKNVNLELVKAGLAEVYRGRLPNNLDIKPYKQAEADAVQSRKGMWLLKRVYISPRAWRKANENYKNSP